MIFNERAEVGVAHLTPLVHCAEIAKLISQYAIRTSNSHRKSG